MKFLCLIYAVLRARCSRLHGEQMKANGGQKGGGRPGFDALPAFLVASIRLFAAGGVSGR